MLPLTLLETRHRIVHRHLPSLAELKRAATESLSWLWEWYWLQLDHAFKTGGSLAVTTEEEEELGVQSREAVREKLQSILKTYVKERKSEIKNRKKDNNSKAAETALSTYTLRYAPTTTTTPSTQTQRVLLHLLVDEKMILPTDKKLGSTMSGAFIIWTPLLRAFCLDSGVLHIKTLVEHLMRAMNATSPAARAMMNPEMDPVREGLQDWIVHVLTGEEWAGVRGGGAAERKVVEEVLGVCFSEPSFWNLKVAEKVLDMGSEVVDQGLWRKVLEAARAEGAGGEEMDVDVDVEEIEKALPVRRNDGKEDQVKEKIKGPTKVLGMWKPRPIGWLPEGWDDDE
ncbi:uncharacterized protein J4E84_006599 [Alternaria hordeiaustralica]|uniref:uncharacterized protein n=1 Tax=Alternaria hordeiaustralica TaxID=1187925 RepID=UPI0020C564E4|nr:uncharacterized protein J4E84_006599 [Alternaria hordeiaustralica]KAI4683761.1 hypothetical protein J4E84_006599 [Alternaria hordeiaustralica]